MSRPSLRSPHAPLRAPAFLLALAGAALVAPAHAASRTPALSAAVAPPSSVVVAVPTLNLRAAPRLSAPVVRRLSRGTVLRLHFYHISWAAVTAPDDTIGYVDRYAVRALAAAPTPAASPITAPAPTAPAARVPFRPPYLTVATAVAILRAAPDHAAPILATLSRRTPLALLGVDRTGTWARVVTRGPCGLGRALPDAAGLTPPGREHGHGRPPAALWEADCVGPCNS